MATQEEIEQFRTLFKKEQKKRDRMAAMVYGLLSIAALGMLIYSFVREVETQKKLILSERNYIVEKMEAQKEAVNCKNEITRLQNELTVCKK